MLARRCSDTRDQSALRCRESGLRCREPGKHCRDLSERNLGSLELGDFVQRFPNGTVHVRFTPVSAADTSRVMNELIELWARCLDERWIHPLIALAAFSLDFLSVHPFRDGNGRTSRLLLLLQCYHLGYEVGCYISLERLIEQNKERYSPK